MWPGADLRAGADALSLPQGFDPSQPKESPVCTVLRYPCLVTDPKNFLKAPLAPIYNNFEREARAEKRNFLVNNFQKVPKNTLFGFFQNFACGADISPKTVFLVLWESLENQFGRPKKNGQKFLKIFDNPPLEKILDPPLGVISNRKGYVKNCYACVKIARFY